MQTENPKNGEAQQQAPKEHTDSELARMASKVVGNDPQADEDGQNAPAHVNTAISSGAPIDAVGGAGMGLPPGEGDLGSPAAPKSQEKTAPDPQDRRDASA